MRYRGSDGWWWRFIRDLMILVSGMLLGYLVLILYLMNQGQWQG